MVKEFTVKPGYTWKQRKLLFDAVAKAGLSVGKMFDEHILPADFVEVAFTHFLEGYSVSDLDTLPMLDIIQGSNLVLVEVYLKAEVNKKKLDSTATPQDGDNSEK